MAEHTELGKKGEEIALMHLKKNSYKILKTNWRFGKEEIDIIAEKDDYLVVVEVKTRQSTYYGEPEIAVNKQKQKILVRAAQAFVERYSIDLEVRFDIISIIISSDKTITKHIEDAFYPTL